MERFLVEYANYQKKSFKNNQLMKQEYKDKAVEQINHALRLREKGLITVDDTIQSILNCIKS